MPDEVVEAVTNGSYEADDFGPIGDAARRIASYCEGSDRLNVYRKAKLELAALAAAIPAIRAQAVAEIVAWLRRNNAATGAVGLVDRVMCSVDDYPWDIASALADAIAHGQHENG